MKANKDIKKAPVKGREQNLMFSQRKKNPYCELLQISVAKLDN